MIPSLSELKLALMAGAAFALVVGTAWVTHHFDAEELERFKATQFEQAAKDNAKALAQQAAHDVAVTQAVSELNRITEERNAQSQSIRKAINAAPKTRACVDSPAIRALFGSVQQRPVNGH